MGRPGWYYDGHPPACTCVACNEGGGGRSRSTATATSGGGRGGRPTATATYESENGGGGGGWIWILLVLAGLAIAVVAGCVDTSDIRRFIASFQPTPAPVVVVVVTATPADTPTGTSTATAVPTLTPTGTNIPVLAVVQTSAATHTPTPTPTATLRPTFTPTVTKTATSTATGTATGTPTTTPTVTATAFVCGRVEMVLMGAGKKHRHCHTPTPTLAPGATRAAAPTFTPVPANTTTPTQTATGTPIPTNTPRVVVVALHTNTPAPTATPIPTTVHTAEPVLTKEQLDSPHLRHLAEKQYMLELINSEREKAGLEKVVLGDNIAAQLHAESALENCFSSHWGIDGLKPYMRYSLAGGYQSNGENGHGSDYCIKERDGYRAIRSATEEVRQAVEGWMESPGHRRNILGRFHKKVNIGLAWDRFNFLAYQHFEGDYVEFSELPDIENGGFSFAGTSKNGVQFAEKNDLGVQVYYDAKPRKLTRGQVSRTYCYDNGLPVAALRPPLAQGWRYNQTAYTRTYKPCPDPYDVSPDALAPQSHSEAGAFWKEAYDASRTQKEITVHVPWITASNWTASGESFAVKANINEVLEEHGDGVYRVVVWGDIDGERAVISEYSIFHGITPPDAYTPR